MSEMFQTLKEILRKKDHSYYELSSNLQPDTWNAYPRPQMRRQNWQCLNGIWKIGNHDIRVPFPPQASLSNYECQAIADIPEELLYERTFQVDSALLKSAGDRIILHFGAVDQIAQIFMNGCPVLAHEGGYLPFSVDITDYLRLENRLSVFVQDHLEHKYPWGKQRKDRGGMWYTPCSGIWQTVWLEAVPAHRIHKLKITPVSLYKILIEVEEIGEDMETKEERAFYQIQLDDGNHINGTLKKDVDGRFRASVDLSLYHPVLWSPEVPKLYPITICLDRDRVESYFALRTVSIRRIREKEWICLNEKPVFLCGVLDQGYFCDGLFLPANPKGYEQDILAMKALGFNMLRKHIKVEPEQFYYDCDRLGMLVIQDMVNNGPYFFPTDTGLPTLGVKWHLEGSFDGGTKRQRERKRIFLEHAKETIAHLYNHPSIIGWTVFNEGWGQYASDQVGDCLRLCDPERFFDYTSGWFQRKKSQVESIHEYFHPRKLIQSDRPLLLSECGGYTRKIEGHTYCISDSYGYGRCEGEKELTERIIDMYEQMIYPSIPEGLCGMVYTQVSDVEDELNGFYTYDRIICKVDKDRIAEANHRAHRLLAEFLQYDQ